ncbi:uncharacterized protein BXIN_1158 [Babesia sp. Xinjiang]|uniref:uncharacterized protein n=1 Tax=Babesia sp. Xinjiang TaxID=462227 RepID=UPI000A21D565|nr:uncharacterized protein BXIN_1158 [Babesia sp. Xinjiang]ORM40135.1 hypothetical protein BXIN_1158 [Babesia sp. Xinjiang]
MFKMQSLLLFLLLASRAFCDTPGGQDVPSDRHSTTAMHTPRRTSSIISRECARIYGSGLRVCSAVHVNADAPRSSRCSEISCKSECCKAASICQNSSFLSLTTEECISSRLKRDMKECCVVGESKGATMVYAGGAVGAMIIISGLYFIVSMGSTKVIKGEKPPEDDSEDSDKLYEAKMPHMEVNQLIATDGDDVFWED